MATGDPADDVGVEAGAMDEELPLVEELPAAALCWPVPGRIATIPATLSALATPAPAVIAATVFFPCRLAAWAAEPSFLAFVMRPACRPCLRATCRPVMRLLWPRGACQPGRRRTEPIPGLTTCRYLPA